MHHARFRTETTRAVYRQVRFCPTADVAAAVASALRARQGEAAEPRAVGARALGVAVVDAAGVQVAVVSSQTMVTVGRHAACDLHLGQAVAALRHVVAFADDDGVHLVDLTGAATMSAPRGTAVRVADSVVVAVVADACAFSVVDVVSALADVATADLADGASRRSPHLRLVSAPSSALWRPSRTARLLAALQDTLDRQRPVVAGTDDADDDADDADDDADDHHDTDDAVLGDDACALRDAGVLDLGHLRRPVLLGRYSRNDVVIDDLAVSRVHAAIIPMRCSGLLQAVVIDVGSTNGTAVGRRTVGQRSAFGRRDPRDMKLLPLGPVVRGQRVVEGDMIILGNDLAIRVTGQVAVGRVGHHAGESR